MNWYGTIVEKGAGYALKPIGDAITGNLTYVAHIITEAMPEIGAGVVVVCAVGMMLTGDISKWLGRCAIGLGGAIIWLLNA